MNLHEKLNENTTLYYIESAQSEWDESTGTEKTLAYQLSFGFYDCTYMVLVTREDIETDEGGYLSVEGDSKLFDSFNEMVEGELWEQIKTKCKAFDKWYAELCA